MKRFFSLVLLAAISGLAIVGCKTSDKPEVQSTTHDSVAVSSGSSTSTDGTSQASSGMPASSMPAIGSSYIFSLKTYDLQGKPITVSDTVTALEHQQNIFGRPSATLFEERNKLAYSRFYISYDANGDIAYRPVMANANWLIFPIGKPTSERTTSDTATRLAKIRTTTIFTPVGKTTVTINGKQLEAVQVRRNRIDSTFTQFDTTISAREYNITYLPSVGLWSQWDVKLTFNKPGFPAEEKSTSQQLQKIGAQ